MKILIVEDNVDLVEVYQAALELKNHEVTISLDGEMCLKIYREELKKFGPDSHLLPFDVVVIDYKIPKKDGLEVANEILALRPTQRIIFTSAYIKEIIEKEVKTLLHNSQRFIEKLQKPFELTELTDKIELKELTDILGKFGFEISADKLSRNYIECEDLINRLRTLEKEYLYN
ncbi:MAG: response regulator [Nitrososphaeraceae archaeon]